MNSRIINVKQNIGSPIYTRDCEYLCVCIYIYIYIEREREKMPVGQLHIIT